MRFITTLRQVFCFTAITMMLLTASAPGPIPMTGFHSKPTMFDPSTIPLPTLPAFINSVDTGSSTQLTGVYVADKMAYPVVQQPANNLSYVSTLPGTVTQFGMASKYHSIGLLAHNYLAGDSFSEIEPGDFVTLVYGNGSTQAFWVYAIRQYQALSPNDPYSNFRDLKDPTTTLTSTDLFNKTYGLGVLVLQTCIQRDQEPSWGRMFILAQPVNNTRERIPSFMPRYTASPALMAQ
jgi:hypothetical protein